MRVLQALSSRSFSWWSRLHRVLLTVGRWYSEDFINELEHTLEARIPDGEVNKRLSSHEITYTGASDFTKFSANQVGVNRPVEDRWRVSQFGLQANKPSYSTESDASNQACGGTIYTVVDGHGGHACAHAVNILHPDYIVAGLLPAKRCESLLADLNMVGDNGVQYHSQELAEVLWTRPEARLTPPTSEIKFIKDYNPETANPAVDVEGGGQEVVSPWAPWGPWGPLPVSVRDVHLRHLRKFLEESLSTSLEEVDYAFDDSDLADIVDPEGCLIASCKSLREAVRLHGPSSNGHPSTNTAPATEYFQSAAFLHNHVSSTALKLRNCLRRMDLDITTKALPRNQSVPLDKALLRIAFSGSVTTSAYVPHNGKELFISQVGDCGAVLGSYSPQSEDKEFHEKTDAPIAQPTKFSSDDWTGSVLVPPHCVDNEAEVARLKNSHPVHESCFLTREDRLLGELVPLRAYGDIRFKWDSDDLKHVGRLLDLPPNYPILPNFYTSPPYLMATPQVVWRPLVTGKDCFLILATDGLWDMISAKEAVNVVAQHWFDYDGKPCSCGPGDTAASRLIRTALGGESMVTRKISVHFSMPATVARYYRDDITVIVAYLPSSIKPPGEPTD